MGRLPPPRTRRDGTRRPGRRQGAQVGYLAGLIAIACVVFGWSLNIGFPIVAALLLADFVIET